MTPTLRQTLAAMPARQLNLLAMGVILIAATLVWTLAIRAPLANLRQQQVRLAALDATTAVTTTAPMPAAAPAALPAPTAPPSPPSSLDLIAAVSAGALDAGVTVARAVPGPERVVAGLRQQTLEIEASGGYGDILAWLDGIEVHQPAVGILRLDLRPGEDGLRRVVRLQLAAYSAEAKP